MDTRIRSFLISCLLPGSAILTVCTAVGYSQEITGTILGAVRDSSGGMVPQAAIAVRNEGTGARQTFVTSEAGTFVFPLLPPGKYELAAQATGFRQFVKTGLVVEVNQPLRVDIGLLIGEVTDTVRVEAESATVTTDSGSQRTTLDRNTAVNVPNLTRNPLNLAFLAPNASPSNYGREGYTGTGSLTSFSGARFNDNELLMDGASLLQPPANYTGPNPNLEAVAEVLVNTNAYSAEFGRALGATISLTTRSGTNDFHGALWEFNRISALMARNFFDRDKPRLTRNTYGFAVGGPMWLPKIYNGRNRTFFFLTFEGIRQVTGRTNIGTVPTAAMKRGDFRGHPQIFDPASAGAAGARLPFANNVIPSDRIDSVAWRSLQYYPDPNLPGEVNNYTLAQPVGAFMDRWVGKLDQNIGERQRLFVRVLYDYTRNNTANEAPRTLPDRDADPAGITQLPLTPANIATGHTLVFSPRIVNELRANYMRMASLDQHSSLGKNYPEQLGLRGVDPRAFPRFNVQGALALGVGNDGGFLYQNMYNLSDSVSLALDRHLIKFGGSVFMTNLNRRGQGNISGTFNFNQLPTSQIGASGTTGDPFASFLLGIPTSTSVQARGPYFGYFALNTGLYFQDNWRVTPSLTLNLGVRWELETPLTERYDRISSFDLNTRSLVFGGDNGIPRGFSDYDLNNIGPRIGFAWSPRGTGGFVLRGGYGLFFANMFSGQWSSLSTAGFSNSVTYQSLDNGVTFPLQLQNGVPPVLVTERNPIVPAGANVSILERRFPTSSMHQWNLSLERQVGAFLVQTTYQGSKGSNLIGPGRNINQVPIALLGPGNAQERRPFPDLNNVIVNRFAGLSSFYHGFSVAVNRRYAGALTLTSSYTWQKSIDYGSGGGITDGATYPQNQYDYRPEKSLSQFDRTHRAVAAAVWQIPFLRSSRGFAAGLAKDWELSGMLELMSGTPVAVGLTPNISNSLGGNVRPNRVPGVKPETDNATPTRWFNTAAYAPPAPFTLGDVSRTEPRLRNPSWQYLDVTVARIFRVSERLRIQFRAEGYNVLNRANFRNPNTQLGVPQFGQILSANPSRRIQFALRVEF